MTDQSDVICLGCGKNIDAGDHREAKAADGGPVCEKCRDAWYDAFNTWQHVMAKEDFYMGQPVFRWKFH